MSNAFRLSRRQFVQHLGMTSAACAVGAAGALAPLRAQARSAEFTLKYAHNQQIDHPMNIRAKEAADAIRQETHGRVDIQIFPSGQLGSDTDMFTQVRTGAIDFFTLSGLVLATLVPVASINGLGYAFKDYDQVWAAMDGDLGKLVRDQLAKVGLIAMEKIWDDGFRQVTSSVKLVATPDDFHNFKIRVPVSPMWTSMFQALGATPTSINVNEVYSALQTKVVDGQENALAIIDTMRFYEVQKYCSLTNHMWDGWWFLANARSLNRLPKDLQEIVARHINAAAMRERQDIAALNARLETGLAAKGLKFGRPDTKAFRDVLQKNGFYAQWRKKYGEQTWAVLEKYTGKLA
ncbi:MAG: TRAP transporter substrate-binding protein [Paraburkholderia sp.]|nr:TRAP transporter substrate-binding protein [Paraburkholderia sp.]